MTKCHWLSIVNLYWPCEIEDLLISSAHIIHCTLQDWFKYQDYALKLMSDGEYGGDSIVARSLEDIYIYGLIIKGIWRKCWRNKTFLSFIPFIHSFIPSFLSPAHRAPAHKLTYFLFAPALVRPSGKKFFLVILG